MAAIPFDLLLFGSDTDEVLQALTNNLIQFKVCEGWVPFRIPKTMSHIGNTIVNVSVSIVTILDVNKLLID